ncbi:MAG: hypothetical protein NTW03_04775 [Verrucomicrobia bacterium]|nr:hypothetical protein [Verrucomicrobiota bacterium]
MSTHRSRTKLRPWMWAAAGFLPLLIVAAILFAKSTADVRKLSDGTFVSLAKVTVGRAHRMRLDNRWQSHLGALLPDALATKLGGHYERFSTARNRWVFWVSWTRPMDQNYHEAALYDEHGCFLGWTGRCHATSYQGASPWFEGFSFAPAPPNTKTAQIRLFPLQYERDRQGRYLKPELARFTMSNPSYSRRRETVAEAFPITHSLEDINFTVVEVWTGVSRPGSGIRAPEILQDEGSKARVGIARGGQPARHWAPLGILEVLDESGNTVEGYYQAWNSSSDAPEYLLQGPPLCSEAVYRVLVGFEQTGDLPEAQVREFRLPVPPASEALLTNLEAFFPEWRLQLRGVAGTNATLPGATDSDGKHLFRGASYTHAFSVDVDKREPVRPPPASTGRVRYGETRVRLLEVRDDQGREIRNPCTASWDPTPRNRHYALNVPPGAKEMILRFAELRPLMVEYRIQPKRFKAKPEDH